MRTTWTGKGKPASGGKGVGKPASRSKGKPASGGNGENTFLARDVNGAGHWREVAARWQLASSLAAAPASDRLGNARAAAPTCLAENRSVWCARRCGEVLQEGLSLGIPQPGNSLGQFRIVRSDLLCTAQPTRHDGSPRGAAMQRRVVGAEGGKLATGSHELSCGAVRWAQLRRGRTAGTVQCRRNRGQCWHGVPC